MVTLLTLPDVRSSLVTGQNLLAVTCQDRGGGSHGFWGALTVVKH